MRQKSFENGLSLTATVSKTKGLNATEVELDDLPKIKLLKKDVKKIGNDTLEILTRK